MASATTPIAPISSAQRLASAAAVMTTTGSASPRSCRALAKPQPSSTGIRMSRSTRRGRWRDYLLQRIGSIAGRLDRDALALQDVAHGVCESRRRRRPPAPARRQASATSAVRGQRKRDVEGRALADPAGDVDGPTVLVGDLAADVQPQAQAAVAPIVGVAAAMEALEQEGQVLIRDADAVVGDRELGQSVLLPDPQLDRFGGIRVLHRVTHQVLDELPQPGGVERAGHRVARQ